MSLIILTLLLILLLIFSLFMAVCTIDNFWRTLVARQAPFVPIPQKVIPHIIDAIGIHEKSIVYDLGCGDARVLMACYEKYPTASYKGIDIALIPRMLAWFHLKRIQKPHTISVRKGDFFKEDISDATHIFVYLFPNVMNDLLPKFQRECVKGTRIVSCDFQFQDKEPIEIIDLHRPRHALGRKIYVYEV